MAYSLRETNISGFISNNFQLWKHVFFFTYLNTLGLSFDPFLHLRSAKYCKVKRDSDTKCWRHF